MTTTDTLAVAKQTLKDNWEDGVECPCCKQLVKLYRRRITSQAAIALIKLRKSQFEWVHWRDFVDAGSTGDFARLRYYKLVEKKELGEDEDKSGSGFWRITPQGKDFVNEKYKLSEYIHIYNDRVYKYSGKLVYISECLSNKFNYKELMEA